MWWSTGALLCEEVLITHPHLDISASLVPKSTTKKKKKKKKGRYLYYIQALYIYGHIEWKGG